MIVAPTIADVRFDPSTHTSWLPDGREVPHVTGILRAVGVAKDFDELRERVPSRAEEIRIAGARGTAVHADCHAYDDDDLDWGSVDLRVRPYVEAWATCRKNLGLVPLVRERQIFNPFDFYTGFKDGIFWYPAKRRIVLGDIKTGDPESSAAQFQTAAYDEATKLAGTYAALLRDRFGNDPTIAIERWAIWLKPDRRIPYETVNYSAHADAHQDYQKFRAFCVTYREQAERRPRRR